MSRPFAFVEFVACLRALLRRPASDVSAEAGLLRLDRVVHAVIVGGKTIVLTPTSFDCSHGW